MAHRNSPLNSLVIALLLGIAGFIGNWFNLQLFFNVDFLFGSFFVMLAVARGGLLVPVTAGLVAGSCTYLLWNHPWAVVIFTAEALFVAFFSRRHPGKLVILDTLYWLCLGMPLVWLFYHLVMGFGTEATLLIVLKQSINGIINALLATILIYCSRLLRPAAEEKIRLIPLSQLIFTAMVSVSIIPCFVYLVHDIRGDVLATEKDVCRRVNSIAESSRDILKDWISVNQQSVVALAQLVGDPNTAGLDAMQPHVEALHLANPALLRVMVADSRARSVAFSPRVDAQGKSTLGIDYSDRSFIPLLQQGRPVVSDVELSRVGLPGPRLAFVAPIVRDGRQRGFCAGIVKLDSLTEKIVTLVRNRFADITVLDRQGKVVASSSERWKPMERFGRAADGEVRRLANGIFHWVPVPKKGVSIMQRWRESVFVKEITYSADTPWTIVIEGSLVPYLDQLNRKTIDELLLLWGLILLTLPVSHLLSRRFVVSLQRLEKISTDFTLSRTATTKLDWPATRIRELFTLVGNFRLMAGTLGDHLRELYELNLELERRVEERTERLQKSEERYRRIVNTANEGIWVLNRDAELIFVNRQLADFLGYGPEELIGRPVERFMLADELPDHAKRMMNRAGGLTERYERRMCRKDGSVIVVQISATPLFDGEKRFQGAFAMCTDITDRKQAEEQLIALNAELEQRVAVRTAELEQTTNDLESFCYSISHEMRAPIARQEGFSRVLAESVAERDYENLQHYAERICAASSRQRMVVDSLLMLNRLTRTDLTMTVVDLSQISREIVAELLEHSGPRSLQVTIGEGIVVSGDGYTLSVCMRNLLDNAVKYTALTANAEIEFGVRLQEGVPVYFVRDNGAGFDMAFSDKLFKPFSRLHNDSEFPGSGIGLATAQRIIERHGGRIWADAAPEKGATFYFTIGQ